MNISEIASQLQQALVEAQKAHSALEQAKAGLAPLEAAAMAADESVNSLMASYQKETGATVVPVVRRGRAGKRGPNKQKRTPEQNLEIQMKKARTTGEKQGLKGKKLEDFVNAAGKKAAEKSGIPFPPK